MHVIKIICSCIISFFIMTLHAQTIDINGTVTDSDGNPLADVTISLAKQSATTQTGTDGKYALVSPVSIRHSLKNDGVSSIQLKGKTISFILLKDNQRVHIDVLSVDGRHVQTVISKTLQRGQYFIPLFITPASSGMYLIAVTVNGRSRLYKCTFLAGNHGIQSSYGTVSAYTGENDNPSVLIRKPLAIDTLKAEKSGYKGAQKAIDSYQGTHDFILTTASYTARIPAWGITNSWVYVKTGDSVTITASGTWYNTRAGTVGPEGGSSNAGTFKEGALGLRVGRFFERYSVGTELKLQSPRDGYLWFFMNTNLGNYDERSGALTVEISGGDSAVGIRGEGLVLPAEDPTFDRSRLEEFAPVDSVIPVYFETDAPDDPIVKSYIDSMMGGDPITYLHTMVRTGSAVNYRSWEAFPSSYKSRNMRIVHYIGAQKWEDLDRPPYVRNGRTYWDFALSFKPEELSEFQNYGRWGCVPTVLTHESGHVLAPDGATSPNTVPRWIQETYADMNAYCTSDYILAQDNPESGFFGRVNPYCDGYATGAPFLDWIDHKYPGFLHDLSEYILTHNPYPGSTVAFKDITGKDVETLNDEYLIDYNLTLRTPVSECDFPETVRE